MADVVAIKPYISNGLVFHLDGADATTTSWVDRKGGISFTMSNITLVDKGGVRFKGNANSKGQSSTVFDSNYLSSTIEVVAYKYASSGFVLDTSAGTGICYLQGGSYVAFTHAPYKRSAISTQGLNKIFTHSINNDREIFNGSNYNFTTNDTWGRQSTGTFLGIRGNGAYPLNGIIYQIRIYNRKLSEAEILFNQEQDRKRYGIQF